MYLFVYCFFIIIIFHKVPLCEGISSGTYFYLMNGLVAAHYIFFMFLLTYSDQMF